MDEYLDVKIDIFEHTGQRARLRRNLTIDGLIGEIFKEFDDISAESAEKYAVYLKGITLPLNTGATITELDLQPQDELIFDYKHQAIRQMLLPQQFANLVEEVTGKSFEIQWQPAVIGRPTAEAEHNLMLAVNAQLIPNGITISRRHAQITFSDDCYYIEPLTENNPIYLNGKEIPINSRWEIKTGDKLSFGRHNITLSFITQKQGKSAFNDTKSKPIPPVVAEQVQSKPISQPIAAPTSKPPTIDGTAEKPVLADQETKPPFLVIEQASTKEQIGQRIELDSYPCILGRVLPLLSIENGVSRRHAELSFDSKTKTFSITDLKSTNGVTLNGTRIMPEIVYKIKVGALIGLGQDVVLRLAEQP